MCIPIAVFPIFFGDTNFQKGDQKEINSLQKGDHNDFFDIDFKCPTQYQYVHETLILHIGNLLVSLV